MIRCWRLAACLAGLIVTAGAPAQAAPKPAAEAIAAYRQAHERELLAEFIELLKLPNVASDREAIRRNADALAEMLRRRGLAPRLLAHPDAPDAPPLVYAETRTPGAKRTLVLYAHYDGQPAAPAGWTSPPWSPTLRGPDGAVLDPTTAALDPGARVYARSAGDDKAGVMVILGALDALQATGRRPAYNLKIVFEGEEEAGSAHLAGILKANRELLKADLWLICDGPADASGLPMLTYGVRGDFNIDLTVYGPNRPLHSGHYGNWAPNPALRLARLLASMKDDAGRVAVAGWYDDDAPLGAAERQAIAALSDRDPVLMRELGLAAAETPRTLGEAVTAPSLNINGMQSAEVGPRANNIIPATATAVLDVRTVAGNRAERQFERLVAHVRSQGYLVLDRVPTAEERLAHPLIATMTMREGVYAASRTAMDSDAAAPLAAAIREAAKGQVRETPTAGGSLPLSVITDTLDTQTLVFSVANHDDNQHAADENLRLGNLWLGIDLLAGALADLKR